MPMLIALDHSDESPIQFIHNQPDSLSKQQKELGFMVDVVEEPPKVKAFQIARLYGNVKEQRYWWKVETKPTLTRYEFFSLIPSHIRVEVREAATHDVYLNDDLEMINLRDEVELESDEVKNLLAFMKGRYDFEFGKE